jgi:riboflavin kinase
MKSEINCIHLTDYSFQKMCDAEFGINRGVYNEIDKWFYNKGIVNILERRREILKFIVFNSANGKHKVRFGNGGLRQKLIDYFDKVAI